MIVTFPDGSRVRASSIADRRADDRDRSYGLYLDSRWEPTWPADLIEWRDFGLPADAESAAGLIESAFGRARRGELVEVGCVGGLGRTGTVLACMAFLSGVPRHEAVTWVRVSYDSGAVETNEQEEWVDWFADWVSSRAGNERDTPSSHDPEEKQVPDDLARTVIAWTSNKEPT